MPSITEQSNFQLTKENDSIEKYLLRIIQRYFEIETEYSKEKIEAIIVEAYQRLKRLIRVKVDPYCSTTDNGDDLYDLFLSGIRLGLDDWSWDDSSHSFVYNQNASSYNRIISFSSYNSYTHRVTLLSKDTDDDTISVVLAYNKKTKQDLSLCITAGGFPGYIPNKFAYTIEYNFTGSSNPLEYDIIDGVNKGTWSTNQINVLVKRSGSIFKIWIVPNDLPEEWIVTKSDQDIEPTDDPTITLDTENYPDLDWIGNKFLRYGYGNCSQGLATYHNAYFLNTTEIYGLVFSLNNKIGKLLVDIDFFGGEYKIEKNTAFNKDFGDIADTICEGNDIRLNNAREPLKHYHEIDEIINLKERLENLILEPGDHNHLNKNVLDILTHSTNTKPYIDLITIEWMIDKAQEYISLLDAYDGQFHSYANDKLSYISDKTIYVNDIISYLNSSKVSSPPWYDKLTTKVDESIDTEKELVKYDLENNYIDKKSFKKVSDIINNSYRLKDEFDIAIKEQTFNTKPTKTGNTTSTENVEGDSLYDIYNSGIRLGDDYWLWDNTTNSFLYPMNQSNLNQFISLTSFCNYTHRVTLTSTNADDDAIFVVLAYDKETTKELILNVSGGDLFSPISNKFSYGICVSENNDYNVPFIISKSLGISEYWLGRKIHVLVKRELNIFKIWVRDTIIPNEWLNINPDKSITYNIPPDIQIDINDYPETQWIGNEYWRYGYGNTSQADTTYENVYFIGDGDDIGKCIGNTNVQSDESKSYDLSSLSSSSMSFNNNDSDDVQLSLRYEDDNNNTIDTKLPYIIINNQSLQTTIIKSYYSDNNIFIDINTDSKNEYYFNNCCVYNGYLYMAVESMYNLFGVTEIANPITIENKEEYDYIVNNLLDDTFNYYINGIRFSVDSEVVVDFNNPFYKWDENYPEQLPLSYNNILYEGIVINKTTKKMRNVDASKFKAGFIVKVPFMEITKYFKNPRIHVKIFGE